MIKLKKVQKKQQTVTKASKQVANVKPVISAEYRNGAEGFIKWCEDHVCLPVYNESDVAEWVSMAELSDEKNVETGRSWKDLWEGQKNEVRKFLVMEKKRLKYRLIVLCWPRGEGKSLVVCLIQLWKFFNWTRQNIVLGANSKDQTKFVHYDIMRDIIRNSPNLFNFVGEKNIKEKEIRITDARGQVVSTIRSISSFSGIVSNITGYTFSEMFDMNNPKFFVQLDGSIRNIPNALGAIDSTVSAKTHILYQLYDNFVNKRTNTLYFSYKCSKTGDPSDYMNPMMTRQQLEDYRVKFPFGEFERYFLNVWSAGTVQVFTDLMIKEIDYIGADGVINNHDTVVEILKKTEDIDVAMRDELEHPENAGKVDWVGMKEALESRLISIDSYAPIGITTDVGWGGVLPVPANALNKLGELYDTDWAILTGADLADPMAVKGIARSVVCAIAKGLPNSKSNPYLYSNVEEDSQQSLDYLYVLLYLNAIPDKSITTFKQILENLHNEYDGIEMLCAERYGAWDMAVWCEEREIPYIGVYPNYDRQRASFNELYRVMKKGMFKAPRVPLEGSKNPELFREELHAFDHNMIKKVFGSPEKFERNGIQDDSIYSVGWALYGGMELSVDSFRSISSDSNTFFGAFIENNELYGRY
jgi:hypothetical protein